MAFFQSLESRADMKGTIRLAGVHEGRDPLHRLRDRHYHSLGKHVIKGALNLFPVLYGYLPPSTWTRATLGLVLMV